jgi:four helix bundle protein
MTLKKTNFENLEIYQLAELLANEVWQIVLSWNYLAKDTVGKQLIKSSDSIGANIAEGSGRGSEQDYRRFFRIARGSLNETRHWLRRAFKRKLLTDAQTAKLTPIIEKLTPKLNAYLKAVGTFKNRSVSKS